MNRDELLQKITAVDFFLIDLHLYLNTHPNDAEAINLYNGYVREDRILREEYEKAFGMLTPTTPSQVPWQWIENPWPWQTSFNFELAGDNT